MGFDTLQFSQDDARVIADRLQELFETIKRANGEAGFRLSLAAPEKLIQLTEAAILAQVNHDIDKTGKGNLLYFADDSTVEHIGYLYGERGNRMAASYALTTLRYKLAIPRNVTTVIAKGYRSTSDNKIFFATLKQSEIPAGELYVDVEAQSLTSGAIGDGIKIGDIKNMVDLVPFVVSVENITVTNGGAEKEELETYKQRLRLLPESFSVAGPDGAYEFWARSANPGIVDARVWMPELDMTKFAAFLQPWGISDAAAFYEALGNYYRESGTGPGNVDVTVLMKNGELPSEEVLSQVSETLSPKTRRPLTDYVHVVMPESVEFNIDFQYWIEIERATEAASIIDAVDAAVEQYIEWQKSRLGLDINPDTLHKLVMNCGVKRVVITEPVYTELKIYEAAQFGGNKSVNYQGLEEA
ncbi:MAG: baseplate J/gp47 family protein [Treponema sp.]|nr:baseplate J/gp47 family protein [Treponema sp.]